MLNYYVKVKGLENYSDEYLKNYIYQNFAYKDLLVDVNIDRAKEQIVLTVRNQLAVSLIPLIAGAIGAILPTLGLVIVEIMIGGAIGESLKQTAWLWIPLVIIVGGVVAYFYFKSKK
jgi:hypothetical protein